MREHQRWELNNDAGRIAVSGEVPKHRIEVMPVEEHQDAMDEVEAERLSIEWSRDRLAMRLHKIEEAAKPFAEMADRMDRGIRDGSAFAGPSPLFAVREECEVMREALKPEEIPQKVKGGHAVTIAGAGPGHLFTWKNDWGSYEFEITNEMVDRAVKANKEAWASSEAADESIDERYYAGMRAALKAAING